jgi:diaminopimelate epimerase
MRQFYRLSGGGNDFLALIEPVAEPDAAEIRALCCRGLSAGADGFFILRKRPGMVAMRYFNADGRLAELCLNGTRCAVQLAAHLGWGGSQLRIETDAGVFVGRAVDASSVALDLPRPASPTKHTLASEAATYDGWRIEIGVPHFVISQADSLATAPVSQVGSQLRHHDDWGRRGSNINFVRFVDLHHLEIRTFERGVEAETLACGTGVLAATATGLTMGALELPVRALTLGGFELVVDRSRPEEGERWSLTGDARLIAEGVLHPGAYNLPPSPSWTP